QDMLGLLSFPPDGDLDRPYPYYDRWGDSFNLSTEFVVVNQSRSLSSLAWLMAQTGLRTQKWTSCGGKIQVRSGTGAARTPELGVAGTRLDLSGAQIVWEAQGQAPTLTNQFTFIPATVGSQWIEAEAFWPDGRRVFAVTNFLASVAGSITNLSRFRTEP